MLTKNEDAILIQIFEYFLNQFLFTFFIIHDLIFTSFYYLIMQFIFIEGEYTKRDQKN